jgi:RNA polymerase sigma-70 factor (ECF subfamily)
LIEEAEGHLAEAFQRGRVGRFQLEAAIQSVHVERTRTGRTEWPAVARFYEQLVCISPALGTRTGYAAAVAEAKGPEAGLAILESIDPEAIAHYQPYWAVRAHLLQRLGNTRDAADAYDRAIGLAEDPAVREFLLQKRGNSGGGSDA